MTYERKRRIESLYERQSDVSSEASDMLSLHDDYL